MQNATIHFTCKILFTILLGLVIHFSFPSTSSPTHSRESHDTLLLVSYFAFSTSHLLFVMYSHCFILCSAVSVFVNTFQSLSTIMSVQSKASFQLVTKTNPVCLCNVTLVVEAMVWYIVPWSQIWNIFGNDEEYWKHFCNYIIYYTDLFFNNYPYCTYYMATFIAPTQSYISILVISPFKYATVHLDRIYGFLYPSAFPPQSSSYNWWKSLIFEIWGYGRVFEG